MRKSTYQDQDLVASDPLFCETYAKQLEKQKPPPEMPEWGEFKIILEEQTNACLTGMVTPEQATKTVHEKWTELLEEKGY